MRKQPEGESLGQRVTCVMSGRHEVDVSAGSPHKKCGGSSYNISYKNLRWFKRQCLLFCRLITNFVSSIYNDRAPST